MKQQHWFGLNVQEKTTDAPYWCFRGQLLKQLEMSSELKSRKIKQAFNLYCTFAMFSLPSSAQSNEASSPSQDLSGNIAFTLDQWSRTWLIIIPNNTSHLFDLLRSLCRFLASFPRFTLTLCSATANWTCFYYLITKVEVSLNKSRFFFPFKMNTNEFKLVWLSQVILFTKQRYLLK